MPPEKAAERLMTRQEAAEFLGLKPQTLNNWAVEQRHFPVIKIGGRCVRYRLSDLQRFIEQSVRPAAVEPQPASNATRQARPIERRKARENRPAQRRGAATAK